MSAPLFDLDLVRRHDVNGPRYTSYPTADRFGDADWSDAYKVSLASTDLSSLWGLYFGLKKGVVAYTLLASHVPLNAKIIGANEHESH